VKFTPRGGEIRVTIYQRGGALAIAIADTGIGIAPEDIPRALERFGQVDSSFSRKYEGTGLGLPLSKRLMELHGGRLDLESAVGIGTTVTASFPAERLVEDRQAA
jgi:signal transduction histidine kinase